MAHRFLASSSGHWLFGRTSPLLLATTPSPATYLFDRIVQDLIRTDDFLLLLSADCRRLVDSSFALPRKLEQDMETVVKVLQPGPLGIIEHKFTAEEIHKANETVKSAVKNWKLNAKIEQDSPFMKDFIDK